MSSVTVTGADKVPTKLIYDYIETQLYTGKYPFLSKDNIFLYNPGALEREIVGYFPRISSALVSRSSLFSTAVNVVVRERRPFALWCASDAKIDCYQIDDTGFIFAQAPPPSVSALTATDTPDIAAVVFSQQAPQYIFEGGIGSSTAATSSIPSPASQNAAAGTVGSAGPSGQSVSGKSPIGHVFVGAHMPAIVALLQVLGQAGFTPTGATVENDQDYLVPLAQGFYIKVSFGEDPENVAKNLHLVLTSDALFGKESQLEYVDLRFGDRVYYKLQGANETQTPKS